MNMKWEGDKLMLAGRCVGFVDDETDYWSAWIFGDAANPDNGAYIGDYPTREAAMRAAEEAVLGWYRDSLGEPVAWVQHCPMIRPGSEVDQVATFARALPPGTQLFALPEVKP